MAFKDFPGQPQGVELLQRSLERGRLAHAYLFTGHDLGELEDLARTLAKALNCLHPIKRNGAAIDCCERCLPCQKISHGNHADVHWARPESKTRVVTVDQMRALMREIQLKPTEAEYKVAIVVAADRLNEKAANAFLKTLEEPPAKSILILLTTEPQRILETILSRCLRLNFSGDGLRQIHPAQLEWLTAFADLAGVEQKSLLGRYRLMDVLLRRLNELKAGIEKTLTARSPLQYYKEAEKETIERWEAELAAAIEAEYRRERTDLLGLLQWWLRDVWLVALRAEAQRTGHQAQSAEAKGQDAAELLNFPQLAGTRRIADRLKVSEALENLQVIEQLQRWLRTNVQEALALEVGLLKIRL
jgi:DNA polymerase-3 subunit delta'